MSSPADRPVAFFSRTLRENNEVLMPLPLAHSGWGAGQLRGVAVSAALARAVEQQAVGYGDLRPARWTLDLFRPSYAHPTTITTTVVRSGRRLCIIDAVLHQHDDAAPARPVARASALFLRPTAVADTGLWQGTAFPEPPRLEREPDTERLFFEDTRGWPPPGHVPSGNDPKTLWQYTIPTVADEPASPFQAAAGLCDLVNAVSNLGDGGLEFINADATLNMSRLPRSTDLGISGHSRTEHDGVVSAGASVFDADGPFGVVTMSGLRNPPIAMELPQA